MSFRKRPKVAVLYLCGAPRRQRLATATDCSGWLEGCLRGEETARFNLGEAFFQREELRDFPPPTGVPEIGQVELILPGVLKPREP